MKQSNFNFTSPIKKFTPEETDTNSPNKIWTREKISEDYYASNYYLSHNTIEKTIEFLREAQKEASDKGYVNVYVQPETVEREEELPISYIFVLGHRLETDEEFNRRVNSLKIRKKAAYDSYKMSEKYYNDLKVQEELRKAGIII